MHVGGLILTHPGLIPDSCGLIHLDSSWALAGDDSTSNLSLLQRSRDPNECRLDTAEMKLNSIPFQSGASARLQDRSLEAARPHSSDSSNREECILEQFWASCTGGAGHCDLGSC